MTIFAIALLIIHILICFFTFIGLHLGVLKVHKYMFFVVLCLPFWGSLAVLFLHFGILFKQNETLNIDVEKMKLDSLLYKGVAVEENKKDDTIVPIEEALIINSPMERRKIIMDVLNDNPKEYVEFLKKAGNNDDSEVVHYAVTAMVEISKDNDYMLQNLETEYVKNPDDLAVLTRYSNFLWEVLQQDLMSGQVAILNRNLYSELVSKKLSMEENLEDYMRYFENEFELGNYTVAGEIIQKADTLYSDCEELIPLKLKYYSRLGKGDKIKELIGDIQNKKMFVSRRVKEAIAFWKD